MTISRTAIALALGLLATSATVQAQTTQGAAQPNAASQTTPRDNPTAAAQTHSTVQPSQLKQEDREFIENATQGSYAEIEGSQLALEKTESQDVKQFAEMMIKDHTALLKEVTTLATQKGVTPPDGPSVVQSAEITALKVLSGGAFDAMYINRIGVASHEATVKMFEQNSQRALDADVKALATKSLPKLREHLEMARALDKKQDKQ